MYGVLVYDLPSVGVLLWRHDVCMYKHILEPCLSGRLCKVPN